jgi:short-subunit dehydrogenase
MEVTIITGASDGIGAELAAQIAHAQGNAAALVLAARSADKLAHVAERCRVFGARVEEVVTDVSVRGDCERLIAVAVAKFGQIDTLVNNAGISAHALLADVPADRLHWYEDLFRVNVWGTIWCTYAALPHLIARKGRVVGVSSLAGLVGVPGRTAYSASKFAIVGFFEALRTELKPTGVSVTVAYPGVVATQIRLRGYNAKGEAAGVSGLKEDSAMSVERCASLILTGMQRRRREVVMTLRGKLGRWLKLIAPGRVESMALAALKGELR